MPYLDIKNIDIDTAIGELLHCKGIIKVKFEDEKIVELPVRKVVFLLHYWFIVRKWGLQITDRYVTDTSVINSATLTKLGTIILDDVMHLYPTTYRKLNNDIRDVLNRLNNFSIDHCQEYHHSLSALDLARIAKLPAVKEITNDKVVDMSLSMADSEKKLKRNFSKLFKVLQTKHPVNALYQFTQLKFINETQLAHIFYQIGFRTDITDSVIPKPVVGNYLNGLRDHIEYASESLSAKKSVFYNLVSIPTAEYFGRRQHLLLSSIRHLYPGDCGTKLTNPRIITEDMKHTVLYKNIIDDTRMVTLDKSNIDQYVGKIVQFRSPIACRHRDGICEICGGRLLSSIADSTHIGIFSGIQMTEKITQTILKAKHFTSTDVIEYKIPSELSEYMTKRSGSIYVKAKVADKFKRMTIGIPIDDATHLMNVHNLDLSNINVINESSFGIVTSIMLMKGENFITNAVSLIFKKQIPLYSKQFIEYISNHQDKVRIRDDIFYVDLAEYDFKQSLFKLVVVSDSMVKFVDSAKKFLETEIAKETSATKALNKFCDLIYQHVKPNIVYPEVVIKAIMISSRFDLRIPIVEDLDNVMFQTNDTINRFRSIGPSFAYQALPATITDPMFYMMPKTHSEFDYFLNLKKADDV